MALTVEDGTGKEDAESYVSVAEANTYFTSHGSPNAWITATPNAKEVALREAAQYLDGTYSYRWKGIRSSATQALDWPRINVIITPNDYEISANEVPRLVKHAAIEAALLSITEANGLMPTVNDARPVKRERSKVGDLETDTEWVGGASGLKKFTKVDMLLRRYLTAGGKIDRA